MFLTSFLSVEQVLKLESELREGMQKVDSAPGSDKHSQNQEQLTNTLIRKQDIVKQSILLDDEIVQKEKALKSRRK